MLGVVQLPYTLMRVSTRATAGVTKAAAGVVTTPVAAVGDDAVARGAVELAGGAVELAAPLHPADTTARQAPAIAATPRARRQRLASGLGRPRPGARRATAV
jgi:hypothetical protein